MADWYYAKGGERLGPVSSAQLRQMAQAGELLPTDMVFKEGGTQWAPASTISNLFPAPAGGGQTRPSAPEPAREKGDFGFEEDDRDRDRGRGRERGRDRDEDEDDRPARRRGPSGPNPFVDILMFRRMITPWVVVVFFWLMIGVVTLGSIFALIQFGGTPGIIAVVTLPLSWLYIRILCELLAVLFNINETLMDIKGDLRKQREGPPT